jgi:hypothetical protein
MTYQPAQNRTTRPAKATGSDSTFAYMASVATAEPAAMAKSVRMVLYSLGEG